MNYFPFHIGDYVAHTGHLEPMEDLAYRRMIDLYYLRENPLPKDINEISRLIRMRDYVSTIHAVLIEFFQETPNGWTHIRCDDEILKMQDKQAKAKASAYASVNARKAKAIQAHNECSTNAQRMFNERSADVQLPTPTPTPTPTPEVIKEANASMSETTFPPCPQQQILKLWKKHLPHLAQPRSWEGTRQANLRQRWIQASKPSAYSGEGYKTLEKGLDWWDSFFAYIAADTKLATGFESQGRTWRPDLEWIVNSTNFQKIIDGKYDK